MFGSIDSTILMSLYEMMIMEWSCAFPDELRSGFDRYMPESLIKTYKELHEWEPKKPYQLDLFPLDF